MPIEPTWQDIAVRLILTMAAGAIIGVNRESGGHIAGFRTTILVGLAASVAMIQASILLGVQGKTPQSFSSMDTLRMPLGILTGVGFIGGGAILRRGDLVTGVTTAATLWIMSVIGLCFGGGQIKLGIAATALAAVTLWNLKWLDLAIARERRAIMVIIASGEENGDGIKSVAGSRGYHLRLFKKEQEDENHQLLSFDVRWKRSDLAEVPADLLQLLQDNYAVRSFELIAEGHGK
jgi:putative Mg2+ transporter-C (MgtC) family protein